MRARCHFKRSIRHDASVRLFAFIGFTSLCGVTLHAENAVRYRERPREFLVLILFQIKRLIVKRLIVASELNKTCTRKRILHRPVTVVGFNHKRILRTLAAVRELDDADAKAQRIAKGKL